MRSTADDLCDRLVSGDDCGGGGLGLGLGTWRRNRGGGGRRRTGSGGSKGGGNGGESHLAAAAGRLVKSLGGIQEDLVSHAEAVLHGRLNKHQNEIMRYVDWFSSMDIKFLLPVGNNSNNGRVPLKLQLLASTNASKKQFDLFIVHLYL